MNIKNILTENLTPVIYVCAKANHGKKWIESRCHSSYTLWLVTEGAMSLTVNESTYILTKGDSYIFNINENYYAKAHKDKCSFIYVHFNLFTLNEQNLLNIYDFKSFIPSSTTEKYFDLFVDAAETFSRSDGISFLVLKSSFMLLMSEILHDNILGFSSKEASGIFSIKFQTLLEYIDKNLSKKLPVSDLANMIYMSEKYFIVYFKDIIGLTPHQYIVERRMKKAYDYLSQHGYSVYRTAELVGYSDQYSFTKAFKAKYGFPPTKIKNTSTDSKPQKVSVQQSRK